MQTSKEIKINRKGKQCPYCGQPLQPRICMSLGVAHFAFVPCECQNTQPTSKTTNLAEPFSPSLKKR